ncbi:MAG: ABC transporter permease [Oscillibacter sp.]|nr:ABC transporter permease [Oscillibacter sp.]
MKLSKNDFKGTGEVFGFTLRQYAKSRANLITGAIMLLLVLISMPVLAMLQKDGVVSLGGNMMEDTSNIRTVYVQNETDLTLSGWEGNTYWSKTGFTTVAAPDTLGGKEALAVMTSQGDAYAISVSAGKDSELADSDLQRLSAFLQQRASEEALLRQGITQEQLSVADADYKISTANASDYQALDAAAGTDDGGSGMGERFILQYGYALVVMMLCTVTTAYIIRAVIEEKSSKLVELLMISVKPLALLTGKILAVMTYVFVFLLVMLAGAVLSALAAGALFQFSAMGALRQVVPAMHVDGVHLAGVIAIALVSLALGYLTVSIVGGISGACCSGTEDMEAANGVVVMLVMAGYMVSVFGSISGSTTMATVLSLLPLVSVFCAPVEYAVGRIGFEILALSWVIQALVICLLALFASRVYAELIIHRGSRVRLKQLLSMAKRKREGAR